MSLNKIEKTTHKSKVSADLVRTYLHEIGRVPLLSHEQEIVYGKLVQRMMSLIHAKEDLEKQLNQSITTPEWAELVYLTTDELSKTITQGQRAKTKMIEANLRLVVAIAKKYQKRNMEFLDLIQEGSLGLERGVEKFDPTKGFKFSTYAYWWIRQAITRAIAQQSRSIRLPIHITEKLNKIKKVQRELSQKLGRSATFAEIGGELNLTPAEIREYFSLSRQPISLDVRVGENQDTELSEMLEDENSSPDNYLDQELMRQDLINLLGELNHLQREVIFLRFGLDGSKEMSLTKIGQRLNISRERVRQLENQALAHLRRKQAHIREYLAS